MITGESNTLRSEVNPSEKVFLATSDTGHATRKNKYAMATKRNPYVSGVRLRLALRAGLATAHRESLEHVEQHDHDQRHDEQHRGDRGGRFDLVALDEAEDTH